MTPTAGHPEQLRMGQGLIGQCAVDGRRMLITGLPADVVPIRSGLFKATPNNVVVLPVLFEGQVKAVIELARSVRSPICRSRSSSSSPPASASC